MKLPNIDIKLYKNSVIIIFILFILFLIYNNSENFDVLDDLVNSQNTTRNLFNSQITSSRNVINSQNTASKNVINSQNFANLPANILSLNNYLNSLNIVYSRYQAKDYDPLLYKWADSSPYNNNIYLNKNLNTGITVTNNNGNGNADGNFIVLHGNQNSEIHLTTKSMQPYTLIYICRYNGPNQNTIFSSYNGTFVSGFAAGINGGLAGYSPLNPYACNYGSNWFIAIDGGIDNNRKKYRTNGIIRGDILNSPMDPMGINVTSLSSKSDFDLAEVIIFSDTLTLNQCSVIENYLSKIYGITLNV